MASSRRRYYAWLFKAYLKRMKKTIASSIVLGILVFFAIAGLLNFYFRPLFQNTTKNIGYWGTYTTQNIPDTILGEISNGLTVINRDSSISKGIAESWTINNNKEYTFKIKHGITLHDGSALTAKKINYNFENVKSTVIDDYTVRFILKDPYSPFLSAVSKPVLLTNFSGTGRYKIKDLDINGGFIKTILLEDTKDKNKKKKLYFYPNQKALKVAFLLGEVDKIYGLTNTKINDIDLSKWEKVKVEKYTNYDSLVTLFYNNNDSVLGNKKLRQALNYSLPPKFEYGERAFSPIPSHSIYFEKSPNYGIADIEISKTLLSTIKEPMDKPLEISTTDEFEPIAELIQKSWDKIGIKSRINIVTDIPSDFQVLLYPFKLPKDPDQYMLWHSGHSTNIAGYKNLRIDKLLEDGRSITDIEKRKKIYADFQKYLIDDVPASFLYFPNEYNVIKD